MAYKALYRQFRPRRFSELKGQDAISTVLKNQIRSGKPSHAYLFSGPRGTGKTSSAKIMASALNCLNSEDGEPCLKCENCLAALSDTMPDIIEMDAASNNGVEEARNLRDKINLMPIKGKYKVYIIDEVHMLSQAAFNALLKTIEEPPDYAVFILATTELRKLPKTILSRCQRFDFKSVEEGQITLRLKEVLGELDREYDEQAITMIADAADGGLRDALSILDKCCSVGHKVTRELVSDVLNLADAGVVRELADHLGKYDEKQAMLTLAALLDSGIEPATVAEQLTEHLRKLLVASVTGGEEMLWTRRGLLKALEILADTEVKMKLVAKPAILLETAIVKMLLPEREETTEGMELRLEKMERRLAEAMAREPQVIVQEVSASAGGPPRPKKKKQPPKISPEDREFWEKTLAELHKKDLGLYARIKDLKLLKNENQILTLTGEKAAHVRLFAEGPAREQLQVALEELTGSKYGIETELPEDDLKDIPEGVEILD